MQCLHATSLHAINLISLPAQLTTKERRLETLDSEYEQRKSENASDIESRRRLVEEASQETALLRNRLAAFNSNQGKLPTGNRQAGASREEARQRVGHRARGSRDAAEKGGARQNGETPARLRSVAKDV